MNFYLSSWHCQVTQSGLVAGLEVKNKIYSPQKESNVNKRAYGKFISKIHCVLCGHIGRFKNTLFA